ncbi:nicolin-1 isoform X2 [Phyllobates terribilis]|uniref:nicolin-1 isoform X2 n=1 Tax=Phyllobates terribilis TaxID=111132 RepID=UPI003CCA999D
MSGSACVTAMAQEAAACSIRTPVPLQVGDGTSEPGVSVIDVTFPAATPRHVRAISFRNFYTAFLTVKIQQLRPTATKKSRTWRTCVRSLRLMPDPHMEEGSQDYVSVCRQQMSCDADNVTALRFILRQPSPVWLTFTLEELQINPPGRQSPQKPFSWWLSHLPPREELQKLHKGLPDPERVSSEVQRMWALTEVMRSTQSTAAVGRFDVDGCYDINLLSYT